MTDIIGVSDEAGSPKARAAYIYQAMLSCTTMEQMVAVLKHETKLLEEKVLSKRKSSAQSALIIKSHIS